MSNVKQKMFYVVLENVKDFNELEEKIYGFVCNLGCDLMEYILKSADEEIMEIRDKKKYRLKNSNGRENTIITLMGEVTYNRRYYRGVNEDGEINYCYLLDHILGIEGKEKFLKHLGLWLPGNHDPPEQKTSPLTGRTAGKFIFRLQVINDKCSKPNIQQAFIRAIFWLFEVNPFLLLGAINFFITKGNEAKQRFGDRLAKTYVVKTKDLKRFLQNPEFQAMESEQLKYEHNKPKFLSYKQDVQGAILNKKVEVIIEGDKTKKIAGLQGMTMNEIMEEINRGGKFVVFKSCVSAIIVSETKESDINFIKSQEPVFKYHWPATLKTILLGWWSITGFLWTIDCLRFNFSGGLDVTDVYKIAVSDSLLSKHNRASCYTSEEL